MRWRLDGDPNHNYQVERHNSVWSDHVLRTQVTAGMVAWLRPTTIADPACGDASILNATYQLHPFEYAYLSDISQPNIRALHVAFAHKAWVGDVFNAIEMLEGHVDVIVLTEILEHLEDPDALLRLARTKARALVASSPIAEQGGNPEHLWGWDLDGYQTMITEAGWQVISGITIQCPPAAYQLLAAR